MEYIQQELPNHSIDREAIRLLKALAFSPAHCLDVREHMRGVLRPKDRIGGEWSLWWLLLRERSGNPSKFHGVAESHRHGQGSGYSPFVCSMHREWKTKTAGASTASKMRFSPCEPVIAAVAFPTFLYHFPYSNRFSVLFVDRYYWVPFGKMSP